MDKVLKANNLGTIADCKDEMPIIIQGFQLDSLKKYATLSDLPLVFLTGTNDGVDWDKVSENAHGVGPSTDMVVNADSITGDTTYSTFI